MYTPRISSGSPSQRRINENISTQSLNRGSNLNKYGSLNIEECVGIPELPS